MARSLMTALVVLAAASWSASGLVAPATARRSVAPARRGTTVVGASAAEVSIAASQQLLSLAVIAVGEGAWASQVGGFEVGKALQCLGPAVVSTLLIVASSGSVSSGVAASMAPGLAASTVATMVLLGGYGLRLAEKQTAPEGLAPPKEVVGLMFALAFFGFSTAAQSFFAADIVQLPTLPGFGDAAPPTDLPGL